MKLETKLTAVCAALLLVVAAALSGIMLWQVREQSYRSLTEQSAQTLRVLSSDFSESVFHNGTAIESASSPRVVLRYLFQNYSVAGSALAFNGELISSPTEIDPRDYVTPSLGGGIQSARCRVSGKQYLVLGCASQWKQSVLQTYLVVDASYIHVDLTELLGRFVFLALWVYILGLFGVRWLIRRTLAPLAQLQKTAQYVAAGNYAQRVQVSSRDEVGLLAENFNRMAEAVENHVQSLTEQNARQQLFIGSVTHEFKTPLTSLLLNVDTLQNVCLPEEQQQELLESMDHQLHWLEQMVRKLLNLISLRASAQIKPASVSQLLESVRQMTKGTMQQYQTELEILCTADTLPMDRDLLCSALVNLVENSAKASSPGQTVTLRATKHTLEVADRGRGIPQQDLERVTEPFYMCDPSRSKATNGFGLGLALVKEIASVHGASLEIESTPGGGTTVRLNFPASSHQTVISQ